MAYPSAIGCIVIGFSPIASGGPCPQADDLCMVIPSYLYWQYRDDDNLQAFVNSYNTIAQEFVTWFCHLHLPIYTLDPIGGALLDWVAEGLYGYPRPVLGRGLQRVAGPYNTWEFNTLEFNQHRVARNFVAERVDDDLYRRSLNWHFFKGDGRYFNVRWLKRRIMRWLTQPNGIETGVEQTYRVSVQFGTCCQVNITLVRFQAHTVRPARYNTFQFNTMRYNNIEVVVGILGPQFELANQLKEAIEQGVLELPFQFSYVVTVQ